MRQILCFGDSNTFGYIPITHGRYPWGVRWTSILNEKLGVEKYRVIENGLVGRTTIFDDPLRDGRCGTKALPNILEINSPVDLVIIMLGTNDCKTIYGASAEVIGKGISRLINQVRVYSETSKILVISPIHFGQYVWQSEYDPEFSADSIVVSEKLSSVYQKVCEKENVYFMDASLYAEPSEEDQEHLNDIGHRLLAEAVLNKVYEIEKKAV